MEGSIYLFTAFSLTWAIIFVYILSMLRRQKTLEIRIEKIKTVLETELTGENRH
jgi:CcmD family protein